MTIVIIKVPLEVEYVLLILIRGEFYFMISLTSFCFQFLVGPRDPYESGVRGSFKSFLKAKKYYPITSNSALILILVKPLKPCIQHSFNIYLARLHVNQLYVFL